MSIFTASILHPKLQTGLSVLHTSRICSQSWTISEISKKFSDSNFISIINSNKKNVYDISILVTSLVADNNVCSKYKKSSANINGKEGKGDNSEWDSFKRDTKNWSLVHESIKASNLESTENELLLVTYEQLYNYPNVIQRIDIIFHTNSN